MSEVNTVTELAKLEEHIAKTTELVQGPSIQSSLEVKPIEANNPPAKVSMSGMAQIEVQLVAQQQAIGMTRMQHWLHVAETFSPEEFKEYPNLLGKALLRFHGFIRKDPKTGAEMLIKPSELDVSKPDEKRLKLAYHSLVRVPVAECQRAFKALYSQYTETKAILAGPGKYGDKIKALPYVNPQKKKQNKSGKGATAQEKAAQTKKSNEQLAALLKQLNSAPFEWCEKLLHAVGVRASKSPKQALKDLGQRVMADLSAYDKAIAPKDKGTMDRIQGREAA